MRALALLIALGASAPSLARANAPEAPIAVGTSSVPADRSFSHRVERRHFQKSGRALVRTGFAYLSRGDLFTNPGVSLEGTWYPDEAVGVDLLSATLFFSSLNHTAEALRRSTGLLPDSQRPIARLATGARFAFAYGKLLVEELDAVIHVDLSVSAHVGTLITSAAPNLAGDLGLAIQAAILPRAFVWAEAAWLLSYELRTSGRLASGPMASAGIGGVL